MARSDKVKQLLRRSKKLMEQQGFVSERIDDINEAPTEVVIEAEVVETLSIVMDENPEGGSDLNELEPIETDSESPEGG